MIAEHDLLARFDGVKQLRPDRWAARCPAHEDRNPSLSITRRDRWLLHCHAGCCFADV
jgi:putative DNA primase/helicase